jgi:hypothetical protein
MQVNATSERKENVWKDKKFFGRASRAKIVVFYVFYTNRHGVLYKKRNRNSKQAKQQ